MPFSSASTLKRSTQFAIVSGACAFLRLCIQNAFLEIDASIGGSVSGAEGVKPRLRMSFAQPVVIGVLAAVPIFSKQTQSKLFIFIKLADARSLLLRLPHRPSWETGTWAILGLASPRPHKIFGACAIRDSMSTGRP